MTNKLIPRNAYCSLIPAILLAAISLPSTAGAQNPFEKIQQKAEDAAPRGRFFKKLREDIAAARDDDAKDKGERNSERRTPNRETGEATQSAASGFRPPNFGLPNPFASASQREQGENNKPAFRFNQPDQNQLPQPNPYAEQRARQWDTADTRSNKIKGPSRRGFGMKLKEREGGLFVDEIEPRGNAQEVQLKRGDKIVKIGGVEVESQKQFDEIASLLGNGDQIDLVIERKGKESQVTLQFGEAPAADAQVASESGDSAPRLPYETESEIDPRISASGEVPDFAPPARTEPGVSELPAPREGPNSVLEREAQASPNGFRVPNIPQVQGPNQPTYSQEQLLNTIRQQQQVIRQLEQQLQQVERQKGRR